MASKGRKTNRSMKFKEDEVMEPNEAEEIFLISGDLTTKKENGKSNKQSKKPVGKRKTNSPRKKGKGLRSKARKIIQKLLEECEGEDGPMTSADSSGNKDVRSMVTAVCFQEDENEFVDMEVEGQDDFPSTDEDDGKNVNDNLQSQQSSNEEGEISFNNNASRVMSSEMSGENYQTKSNVKESKTQSTWESEEEHENRIITKTVQKLQELMAAGGYLKTSVHEPKLSERERKKKEMEEPKGNKGRNPKVGIISRAGQALSSQVCKVSVGINNSSECN